jgi:hypothetical protein
MPILSNPKWEKFCQAYVRGETAGNASKSYEAAGFKSSRQHANKLLHRRDISLRVANLQTEMRLIADAAAAQAIKHQTITIENLLAEAEAARALAMFMKNPSAAVGAIIAKAKLAGFWVERREIKSEYADKTDDELRQAAAAILEQLAKLGMNFEISTRMVEDQANSAAADQRCNQNRRSSELLEEQAIAFDAIVLRSGRNPTASEPNSLKSDRNKIGC